MSNDPGLIPEDDAAAVDAITGRVYPTKPRDWEDEDRSRPVEDPSGLLLPTPALPPPQPGQSDEDAAFAAVMGRHFQTKGEPQ